MAKKNYPNPPFRSWTRRDMEDPKNWDFARLAPWLELREPPQVVHEIYRHELSRELGSIEPSKLPDKRPTPPEKEKKPMASVDWVLHRKMDSMGSPMRPVSAAERVFGKTRGGDQRTGAIQVPTVELLVRLNPGASKTNLLNSFEEILNSAEFKSLPVLGLKKATRGRPKGVDPARGLRDLAMRRHLKAGFSRREAEDFLRPLFKFSGSPSGDTWDHLEADVAKAALMHWNETLRAAFILQRVFGHWSASPHHPDDPFALAVGKAVKDHFRE